MHWQQPASSLFSWCIWNSVYHTILFQLSWVCLTTNHYKGWKKNVMYCSIYGMNGLNFTELTCVPHPPYPHKRTHTCAHPPVRPKLATISRQLNIVCTSRKYCSLLDISHHARTLRVDAKMTYHAALLTVKCTIWSRLRSSPVLVTYSKRLGSAVFCRCLSLFYLLIRTLL